ncbi:MAG: DUF669 domain-containing protein [Sphaerochaetaceae bacterium]
MKFEPVNSTEARTRELIPNGVFKMQVTEAEVCQTSTGSGQYIKLTWKIMEGQYDGKTIVDRLNIRNVNAEAERIGRGQLASLISAMGMSECGDTDLLLYKPIMGKVGIEKDKTGQYEDKNKVISYAPASKNGPVVPAGVAPAPSAPAPQASAPWLKQGQQ